MPVDCFSTSDPES